MTFFNDKKAIKPFARQEVNYFNLIRYIVLVLLGVLAVILFLGIYSVLYGKFDIIAVSLLGVIILLIISFRMSYRIRVVDEEVKKTWDDLPQKAKQTSLLSHDIDPLLESLIEVQGYTETKIRIVNFFIGILGLIIFYNLIMAIL